MLKKGEVSVDFPVEKPFTAAEQAYLWQMGQLAGWDSGLVGTNALAGALRTTPAAVTDMLKRLSTKKLVQYTRYRGAQLTSLGRQTALLLQRKRCLWEVLLVQQLKFSWPEAAALAPCLAQVAAPRLYQRLDALLQYPRHTPAGTVIPTEQGVLPTTTQQPLHSVAVGSSAVVVAINDTDEAFLQYLHKRGIAMGAQVTVLERLSFDQSLEVSIAQQAPVNLSAQACAHIFVVC